jgi:hypothetical protein
LIAAANDNNNDNSNNSNNDNYNDHSGYIHSDNKGEIECLLEDQKMPPELVLSVAHGPWLWEWSGSSIADPFYSKEKIVFVSLDIENGGEYCGIR